MDSALNLTVAIVYVTMEQFMKAMISNVLTCA